jgi:plastocyanin
VPSQPSRRQAISLLAAALLLATSAAMLWAARPARAANVTITTGGDYPLSCESASYAYSPIDIDVQPGDSVTFSNPGSAGNSHPCQPADHPTRCAPETNRGKTVGDCPFSNFALDTGATHNQTFPAEGTFQLQCLAHPYMVMTVTVGDGDPDEPEPEPTETDEPEPTVDNTDTETREPTSTSSPTAGDRTTQTTAPTDDVTGPSEASPQPVAQFDVVELDAESPSRAPLLVMATALLGFAIAGLLWVRDYQV